MSDAQRARWENRTEEPLIVGAVLFLAAYSWPILQPDLPGWGARGPYPKSPTRTSTPSGMRSGGRRPQ